MVATVTFLLNSGVPLKENEHSNSAHSNPMIKLQRQSEKSATKIEMVLTRKQSLNTPKMQDRYGPAESQCKKGML